LEVVVAVFRGYGDLPLTSAQYHNIASTADVHLLLQRVRAARPKARLLGMGFSLGANYLVKYLGEHPQQQQQLQQQLQLQRQETQAPPLLCAAVTFGSPYDLMRLVSQHEGRSVVSQRLWEILERYQCRSISKLIWQNRHVFASTKLAHVANNIMSMRSMRQFSGTFSGPLYGYSTWQQYYEAASSAKHLPAVRTPLVCVSALDDPIVGPTCIPADTVWKNNPKITIVRTHRGGHLAWMQGFRGRCWMSRAAVEITHALLKV
jgi:predicted alpha/beta-fold hydrolase